jgi:hypothetical protein
VTCFGNTTTISRSAKKLRRSKLQASGQHQSSQLFFVQYCDLLDKALPRIAMGSHANTRFVDIQFLN